MSTTVAEAERLGAKVLVPVLRGLPRLYFGSTQHAPKPVASRQRVRVLATLSDVQLSISY
ncbi:hypothetical protein ACFQZZ_28400 [Nocardia sp. GCM10030253]|uniref:hypothetical protein n=1 Tax=Nocardia sp. GCM10030253 TaxID=3273404 RepID=UPI003625EEE8